MFLSGTTLADQVDDRLKNLFDIRTSNIPSFIQGLDELASEKKDMSSEQLCFHAYLQSQIPYYKGQYQLAIEANNDVIKQCPETTFGVYTHVQNALIYSAQSDYVSAFESLQVAEKGYNKLTLNEEETKHYLSGYILVLVNLNRYDLASEKLLALERLSQDAANLCRVMFNRLNIALATQNYQYSSDARLEEVTQHCGDAKEDLYLQFSQTIWHYFKFIDDNTTVEQVEVWLDRLSDNEPKVLALDYTYLSSAYYATMAQGYRLIGHAEEAKKHAETALSFETLGNVIFKVTAMDVMIAELADKGRYQSAYELLKEKSVIEQNQQFEQETKNMAFSMVEQAVDAKENTIRLLNEQNAVLQHNEELKDRQNRLQFWLILSLLFSMFLILFLLWRVWSKLKYAKLEVNQDYLTKTANRKGVERQLASVFERHDVVHNEVQFGLMNIDDFRKVNDEIGHHAGDFVLIDLVKRCESMLPHNAFMGRTGGEEFCFVMYNATHEEMKDLLNLMREHIMNQKFVYQKESMNLTASFGYTSAQPGGTSYDKLIGHAARALYQAKVLGKNQIAYY